MSNDAKKDETKNTLSKKLKLKTKYEQIRENFEYCENFYNENYLTKNEEFNYVEYQNQFLDAYSYYQSNGQQEYVNYDEYTTSQVNLQPNYQDQFYANHHDNYQDAFYHYQNFSNTF